tara:strand:- start:254 stop:493 length:240 start_codon:yes stop_codon:yes gene_type:complete
MIRKLNKTICTRKPGCMSPGVNFAKTCKRRTKLIKKRLHKCSDGPLDGVSLCLSSLGTLPFSIRGVKGFYDASMNWCKL